MSEETKDCTRLPVVAWRIGFPNGAGYRVYEQHQPWAYQCYGPVSYEVQDLCRLTDAQALIAELRAENERLKRTIEAGVENELALVGERTELRAQLEKLQAAPAERGVVVLPELKVVEQAWGYDEGGNYAEGFAEGYNDAIDDVQRLNPAPATADSDVPGIPVEHEDEATVNEFGGIVESCHFCRAPTRYWHTGTNNPVCPDCAKKHRVEELPNWLADSDVREVKK